MGKKKRKKRVDWVSVLLVLILIVGLGILAYPSVADWWNSTRSSRALESYATAVESMPEEERLALLAEAEEYNAWLADSYTNIPGMGEESLKKYMSILDLDGHGMMGSIEIPRIRVQLPLYHTVEEGVLLTAAGHLPGSSLPVGGDGCRTVVTGHRGLTSATLFTHLDKLETGDVFMFKVLKETYTYEVDDIRVVEPEDVSSLVFESGKDQATLVTCTPYGVNSHRLLITGHRIENLPEGAIDAISDAVLITPVQLAMYIAGPVVVLFVVWMFWSGRRKKRRRKHEKSEGA